MDCRRHVRLLVLAASCACAPARAPADEAKRPPDVVLIVIDALRWDHVGCYGYGRPTTPNLDRLAGEGVRFEQVAAASSWTMPGVMTLFTSLPPFRHGVTRSLSTLREGLTTLAAEFRRAGYQTGGITSNPMTSGKLGFGHGFEFYDDATLIFDVPLDPLQAGGPARNTYQRSTSEDVTRLGLKWVAGRDRSRPFFLHLLYFDPHNDYLPPPEYARPFVDPAYDGPQDGAGIGGLRGRTLPEKDRRHLVDLYDGEVRCTDAFVGRLLEGLKDLDAAGDLVVAVVADHGEEFMDHGDWTHGYTLYEEVSRVPWILWAPGRVPAGTVVRRQATHLDLMPTLLAVAGLPIPAQCQGRDLRPWWVAGAAPAGPEAPAFQELDLSSGLWLAVREGRRKAIVGKEPDKPQYYALDEDPGEHHNLAGTPREREFSAELKEIGEYSARIAKFVGAATKATGIDPRLLEQIKSLHYVQ